MRWLEIYKKFNFLGNWKTLKGDKNSYCVLWQQELEWVESFSGTFSPTNNYQWEYKTLLLSSPPTLICKKKTTKKHNFSKKTTLFAKKTTLYTLLHYQLHCYITFYFYIFPFVKFLPSVLIIMFIFQWKFIQVGHILVEKWGFHMLQFFLGVVSTHNN